MIAGFPASVRAMIRFVTWALLLAIVGWGVVTLLATVSLAISLGAGTVALGCVLAWILVQRSRAAHDRAIAATYPSFGPALARRRAEGSTGL